MLNLVIGLFVLSRVYHPIGKTIRKKMIHPTIVPVVGCPLFLTYKLEYCKGVKAIDISIIAIPHILIKIHPTTC